MKDIENRHQGFISRVKSLAREEGVPYFNFDHLQIVVRESGYLLENLVGAGQECVVVAGKEKPEVVIAFTYQDMDPIEAKKTYYAHRVFSTLFPHNFPRFTASFSGEYARTVRERKVPAKREDVPVKFPFSEVVAEVGYRWCLKGGGLSTRYFDSAPFNYVVAADGGEYFLDSIAVRYGIEQELASGAVRSNIFQFMQEKSFTNHGMNTVNSSIDRLLELSKVKV